MAVFCSHVDFFVNFCNRLDGVGPFVIGKVFDVHVCDGRGYRKPGVCLELNPACCCVDCLGIIIHAAFNIDCSGFQLEEGQVHSVIGRVECAASKESRCFDREVLVVFVGVAHMCVDAKVHVFIEVVIAECGEAVAVH